eukprot:m.105002 g.105002  ORF g.105002 m.105002 type:complete len:677 (+) comp9121_c5_seq1:102-2132(+)
MGANESILLDGGEVPNTRKFTRSQLTEIVAYLEKQATSLLRKAESLSMKGGMGWQQEYASFSRYHSKPANVSKKPENEGLNRYRNILAYDDTRVRITPNEYNGNNDYVNANDVPGFGNVNYIASQGPVPSSFIPFWQMIWEQDVNIIAMVTNEVEGGKLKCHRYWPDDDAAGVEFGPYQIVVVSRKDKSHYILRRMIVRNSITGEERHLAHFLYTAWPDHGVPSTAGELLSFRKAVNKEICSDSPILIHCSAGVGRTGTYIAVDTLIRRLESSSGSLNPADVLNSMRQRRAYLVQTLVQYQFIFKALLEAINKRLQRAKNALNAKGPDNRDDQLAQMSILEGELAGVNDEFVNITGVDEEVERLLMKEEGKDQTPWADARHDDTKDDTKIGENVPREKRVESLMQYVTSESWRYQVDDIEAKGYKTNVAGLEVRLASLATSSHQDAWLQRYSKLSDTWYIQQGEGGEEYDLTQSLDPLESRIISLAQQREAWAVKSKEAREELESEYREKLDSLHLRFQKLDECLQSSESRWRERGDGLRGQAVVEHRRDTENKIGGIRDRLQALQGQREAWKDRGVGFRGVLAKTPYQIQQEKKAEERKKAEEEARIKREAEEEAARLAEEEKKKNEPVLPPELVRGASVHVEKKGFKFFSLKKSKPKERKSHPMIDAALKKGKK